MDQDKTELEVMRGRQAAEILNNPLVQEALQKIREEVDKQWIDAPARDTEGRERLWMMRKITDRFEAHFRGVINHGKLAAKRLAELEEKNPLLQKLGL